MHTPTEIDQAAFTLQEAKNRMELVKQEVLNAELHIIHLAGVKDEGTTSNMASILKSKRLAKSPGELILTPWTYLNRKCPKRF